MKNIKSNIIFYFLASLCLGFYGCASKTISPERQVSRINIGEQLPESRKNVFLLDKRNLEKAPPTINPNVRLANGLVFDGRQDNWKDHAHQLFTLIRAINSEEDVSPAQRANDAQLIGFMTFNSLLKEKANPLTDGDYFRQCLNLMLETEPLDVGTMAFIYSYAKEVMVQEERVKFMKYLEAMIPAAKEISSSLVTEEDLNYRRLLNDSINEAEHLFRLKK